MKIIKLHVDDTNSGRVKPIKSKSQNELIEIFKGRYVENETSHPLYDEDAKYFKRIYCLEYKSYYVYWFYHFGKAEDQGTHVGFTWLQHQRFLWLQKRHWLQKEGNIRYLINLIFLVLGAYISIRSFV